MRQRRVNPTLICNQHLIAEHYELHMYIGALNKGRSLEGYKQAGILQLSQLRKRHNELAAEMITRKKKDGSPVRHNSPLPAFVTYGDDGWLQSAEDEIEVLKQCSECKKRIENYGGDL